MAGKRQVIAPRRRRAKTRVKPGYGDKGDRPVRKGAKQASHRR